MNNEPQLPPEYKFEQAEDNIKNQESSNSTDDENGNGRINIFREIIEMIVYFLVILILFMLLQKYVAQHIEVNGRSMENTLYSEDHLILEKVSYHFDEPLRFDIVVFRPFDTEVQRNTYYIKRIIGMPGESVRISDGQIYINDEVLQEDFGNTDIMHAGIASDEITLKDDEYFLLGDNRNNSTDSRAAEIGPVAKEAIIGRAWARIWPIKNMEILDHD